MSLTEAATTAVVKCVVLPRLHARDPFRPKFIFASRVFASSQNSKTIKPILFELIRAKHWTKLFVHVGTYLCTVGKRSITLYKISQKVQNSQRQYIPMYINIFKKQLGTHFVDRNTSYFQFISKKKNNENYDVY